MKRALRMSFSLTLAVMLAGCSSGGDRRAETQEKFGVRMAKMNLWREAMFRFKRTVELDPADATAHNNLAVAYEANGDFEKAALEYREAIRLDKSNQFIQKNYSRFVEFNSRNKKRQPKAATPATAASAGTPEAGATAPVPASTPSPQPPGEGPATSAQPTGTAPASVPPVNPPAPEPPPPNPPPTNPPPTNPPGGFA